MKQSDYCRKFDAAIHELDKAGVQRWNGLTLDVRVARKLGFEPRPPYYQSFAKVAVSSGLNFAILWGAIMHLSVWRPQALSPATQLITAALGGIFFGFSMAMRYRYIRMRTGLSTWSDL